MMFFKHDDYFLPNFEGSLDFLMCLIQREEIEILDVPIQELIQQFIHHLSSPENKLESGSEFIGIASYLVWLKSKSLLPCNERFDEEENLEEDPRFEIIHHLLDYCRFKQAAKELAIRQEKQQACYVRGIETPEWKRPLGIDHISLDELSVLFKEMILKGETEFKPQIQEESWRISDKIKWMRGQLQKCSAFPLMQCFFSEQSRAEMIVIFLAILELMKIGELAVGRDQTSKAVFIFAKEKGSI